jgi:osmotically-inducible protein OsmY
LKKEEEVMKRLLLALAIVVAVTGSLAPVGQAQDRTIGDRVDDARITAALKAKLVADSAKNLVNVNVDTRDGVVHLQGTVSTGQDRAEAERLAKATKGVREVKNDLTVTAGAASPKTR